MAQRAIVVGLGAMGVNHFRVLSGMKGIELAGIVDADVARIEKIKRSSSLPAFPTVQDAISQASFDAAIVATPTVTHAAVAGTLLEAGKHVLVEKPIANSAKDAQGLVDLARGVRRVLAVGHIERFNPCVAYVKELLARSDEGNVLSFTAKRVSPPPQRIFDVGVITDLGSHEIDIICYLKKSKIRRVYAETNLAGVQGRENSAIVTMGFEDGCLASVETNWISPLKIRRLDIITNLHLIEMDYIAQRVRQTRGRFSNVSPTNLFDAMVEYDTKDISLRRQEPLAIELDDFFSAIRNEGHPLVTGQDGLRVVQIMEAALKSSRSGKAVMGSW